jgi:uncharacterized protein YneF (UPF0154 family)
MATVDLNILLGLIGVEFVIALFGFGYWFYVRYIRKVLRARILDDFGGTPKVVRELLCKPHIKKFTWEKGIYVRDPRLDTFDSFNNSIGYWWRNDLRQIEIGIHNKPDDKGKGKEANMFDPRILKTELDAKDMQDLTHGERDKIYFIVIGGLVLALVVTAIAGFYFYSTQTDKLVQLSKQYADLIANMTRTDGGVIVK